MPHDVTEREPGLLIAGRWDEAAGGGRFDAAAARATTVARCAWPSGSTTA
jgi:hypothetical protein